MERIKLTDIPLIERLYIHIPIFRRWYKPFKIARRGYEQYRIEVVLQLERGDPVIGTSREVKIFRHRYITDIEFCFPEKDSYHLAGDTFPNFTTIVSVKRGSKWVEVSNEFHKNCWYTIGKKKIVRVSLS